MDAVKMPVMKLAVKATVKKGPASAPAGGRAAASKKAQYVEKPNSLLENILKLKDDSCIFLNFTNV